jgi:uncharacterized membrane protein
MDVGQVQFVSITALTFGFIGLAIFALVVVVLWIILVAVKWVRRADKVDEARRAITARERRAIRRRIENWDQDEKWNRFIANLRNNLEGEDDEESR